MPYNTNIIEKRKVVGLEIDIGLRNDMVCFIKERIIHSLETTKRFLELKEEAYDDICAGLYTYAVEEYGKILFLNGLSPLPPPKDNKIKVRYTYSNHGFLDHDHKFNLALKDKALPRSCKVLREGVFPFEDFEEDDFVVDTTANMKARMAVFYADFDKADNYNSILKPLEVKRELLVKAVDDFLVFIRRQNYYP
jgi:hypothetical protein